MTGPDQVIAAARECIGTPFLHQARVPGRGMDCAGLIIHVAKSLGFDYQDVIGYPRRPYRDLLRKTLDSQQCLDQVDHDDMSAGDVLLMRIRYEPQHLGVFTGENLIHSYSTVGRVVEHSLTAGWRKRITQVYRFVYE